MTSAVHGALEEEWDGPNFWPWVCDCPDDEPAFLGHEPPPAVEWSELPRLRVELLSALADALRSGVLLDVPRLVDVQTELLVSTALSLEGVARDGDEDARYFGALPSGVRGRRRAAEARGDLAVLRAVAPASFTVGVGLAFGDAVEPGGVAPRGGCRECGREGVAPGPFGVVVEGGRVGLRWSFGVLVEAVVVGRAGVLARRLVRGTGRVSVVVAEPSSGCEEACASAATGRQRDS